jgi:hypothetical protein
MTVLKGDSTDEFIMRKQVQAFEILGILLNGPYPHLRILGK